MCRSADVRMTSGFVPLLTTRLVMSKLEFMSSIFLPFAMPAAEIGAVETLPEAVVDEETLVVIV